MGKKTKKTILVIGGTGFIGFHLLKKTKRLNWESYSISRNRPKPKRYVKGVKYLFMNINNKIQIKKVFKKKYDYIIDLSTNSISSSNKSIKYLIHFLNEKMVKKFIHIGSSSEYGNLKKKFHSENSLCRPVSKYGKKKYRITKNLIKNFKRNYFPLIILRPFQVYGPNDDKEKILPFILNSCLKNKKFRLTEGYQTRDFCYIDDVINAIILILISKKKSLFGNIFNIGSGNSISVKNLVYMIKKNIRTGQPDFGAKKISKQEIVFSRSSIFKIKKYINWHPRISLEKGIKKLIKYEK